MAAATILETIAAHKRTEVAAAKAAVPPAEVRERARRAPPPRDFAGVLRAGFALIAEIKRQSPAAGPLRETLDPAALARQYVAGGARALSVLTDERFFGGRPQDLAAAREAVGVPALRKDFILEPYQVYESRALGADAVLLITALLDVPTLRALIGLCETQGMTPLVEAHTADEVGGALSAGARVIGINNRDLHTFRVDLDTTARLRALIPPGVLVISESGIHSAADVARLRPYVDGILVGTALLQSEDPEGAVRALLSGGRTA